MDGLEHWVARVDQLWLREHDQSLCGAFGSGPTPLIAAMRAYVAAKFGEEVPAE
ncbi:hypothetical protein [Burkholderia lata]|uniref:hypothetical protein n=1 Tax=Burkholderia lata (strain ATCC 17760 / DSM 23089 / LMG 22485 / NCIMB 9086 / R18194 / 383) TaxID=482957 RepID=UPI00399BE5C7